MIVSAAVKFILEVYKTYADAKEAATFFAG